MKTYSKDKTLKILFSLMIVGLFLNFFKPMLKDALAADIDCLIMADELKREIVYTRQKLEGDMKYQISQLEKLVTVYHMFNMSIAYEGLDMSKERIKEINKDARYEVFGF